MSLAYRLVRSTMTGVYNVFLKTPPVLEMAEFFPDAPQFTENWKDIRAEAMALCDEINAIPKFHELMPEQYQLSAFGEKEWRMFVLRAYDLDIEENMSKCPQLAALLRANPQIKSASFSFLAPGKQVPTHTGPFRGITRFYMGLQVPLLNNGEPGVTLTIADKPYRIANGESLLWDDTYPHSVRNDTDQWRIALLMDVFREQMPGPLTAFSNGIINLAKLSIRWRKVFPKDFA